MRSTEFAKVAAAGLLLGLAFAAPAHAQNNKQIISGTYYEDQATNPGVSSGNATLTFAQTPANKFVNVTHVACDVFVTSAQVLTLLRLQVGTTSGASDLGRSYPIKNTPNAPEVVQSGKVYSVVTDQIFFKIGPGRFPSIFIVAVGSATNSVAPNCFIVGTLSDD